MKNLIIVLISISFFSSCSRKTTYIDSQGRPRPTRAAIHMRKVHPHGFWAGGKYIEYKRDIKKVTAK